MLFATRNRSKGGRCGESYDMRIADTGFSLKPMLLHKRVARSQMFKVAYVSMSSEAHLRDFDLVQRVLEGTDEAVREMTERHRRPIEAFLFRCGATPAEAEEVAQQLWVDCLLGRRNGTPLLTKYVGRAALEAWLKTVALNSFLDRKRREKKTVSLDDNLEGGEWTASAVASDQPGAMMVADAPLARLMKEALKKAFGHRKGWEVVMLQLHHLHGLTQRDLASMWGWHEAKVSRAMTKAMRNIADDTMEEVKRADPWLDLEWRDFVELAGNAEFTLFR